MKTIQWRLRQKFRKTADDSKWHTHSEIRDAETVALLKSYNGNDRFFEYRQEPANERKEINPA